MHLCAHLLDEVETDPMCSGLSNRGLRHTSSEDIEMKSDQNRQAGIYQPDIKRILAFIQESVSVYPLFRWRERCRATQWQRGVRKVQA
jgi:hypothetical protein